MSGVGTGVTFLPPGEQVSGGGVLVIFRGLEPQLEGDEPRILMKTYTAAVRCVFILNSACCHHPFSSELEF